MIYAQLIRMAVFETLDGTTLGLPVGTIIEMERLTEHEGIWVKASLRSDYRVKRLRRKFFRPLSPLELLAITAP